jgi:hypothetical protein
MSTPSPAPRPLPRPVPRPERHGSSARTIASLVTGGDPNAAFVQRLLLKRPPPNVASNTQSFGFREERPVTPRRVTKPVPEPVRREPSSCKRHVDAPPSTLETFLLRAAQLSKARGQRHELSAPWGVPGEPPSPAATARAPASGTPRNALSRRDSVASLLTTAASGGPDANDYFVLGHRPVLAPDRPTPLLTELLPLEKENRRVRQLAAPGQNRELAALLPTRVNDGRNDPPVAKRSESVRCKSAPAASRAPYDLNTTSSEYDPTLASATVSRRAQERYRAGSRSVSGVASPATASSPHRSVSRPRTGAAMWDIFRGLESCPACPFYAEVSSEKVTSQRTAGLIPARSSRGSEPVTTPRVSRRAQSAAPADMRHGTLNVFGWGM